MQPDQIVADLLNRGDMNDETTLELNRMLEDWRAGKLDPDDESYLRALHARLMDLPQPSDAPAATSSGPDRLDGLTIAEWRDRALAAEARLADLEDTVSNA